MTTRRFDVTSAEWRAQATTAAAAASDECEFCALEPGAVTVVDEQAGEPLPMERFVWSSEHDATLSRLPHDRFDRLIEVWAERYRELGARADVGYVLISEDRGPMVDYGVEHPHGRIVAYEQVPTRVQHKLDVARAHMRATGRCVLCDVGAREEASRERIVADDDMTVAFVPYAPRFAYEVQVQPKRHATDLLAMSDPERSSLARVLQRVLAAYERLAGPGLTYSLAVQQSPPDDGEWLDVSHLHVELLPVYLSRLGSLGAAELAAGAFTVDIAPEEAAAALRG